MRGAARGRGGGGDAHGRRAASAAMATTAMLTKKDIMIGRMGSIEQYFIAFVMASGDCLIWCVLLCMAAV